MHSNFRSNSVWFLAGLLIGIFVLLGIRFVTYTPSATHYHANFLVYINGQRAQFQGAQYYEEISAMCSANGTVTPMSRAHMHSNVNNVVHVEDKAVTWGNFFANLGWTLGPTFIASPDGTIYQANGDSKLHVILNGQDYSDLGGVADIVIKDRDKLLVSYGNESAASVSDQYKLVPDTAKSYDTKTDPKSCSGSTQPTLEDRFLHMF